MRLLDLQTQTPIMSQIQSILDHIRDTEEARRYNAALIDIHEGNIRPYVESSIRAVTSAEAANIASNVSVILNPLRRLTQKLSKVYTEEVTRQTDNEINQDIIEYYEDTLGLNRTLQNSNELFNLNKYFFLEPYLLRGVPGLRLLTSDDFIPYSDNTIDPTIPTIIIKPLGTAAELEPEDSSQPGHVAVYLLTSAVEVLIVDAERNIRFDLMRGRGLTAIQVDEDGRESEVVVGNPLGFIPGVFGSDDQRSLIPKPDTDLLPMAIDASVQFTNLNYATLFLTHSMFYGVDLHDGSVENLKSTPNTFWNLKTEPGRKTQGGSAEVGVLTPEVKLTDNIMAIEQKLALWMSSRGLRPNSATGTLTAENFSSGIARLIEEADAISIYREQIQLYRKIEDTLWDVIRRVHNFWVTNGLLADENRGLTDDLQVRVQYTVAQPQYSEETLTDLLEKQLNNRLISRRRAVIRLNPDLSMDEIDDLLEEITSEGAASQLNGATNFLDMMNNIRPEQEEEET